MSTPTQTNNYFKGMREAKFISRYPYFEAGHTYELKLNKTYVIETRDKGDAFIAEFEVLKTSSLNQKVGSQVTFYQGLLKNKDTAFASLKGLMYACLKLDPNNEADAIKIAKEVDPEIEAEMQKAVATNHMAGAKLRCQTVTRTGKESGKPYTAHNWSPLV